MVNNILDALHRIKSNLAEQLSAETIEGHCRELGYAWRERMLGPVKTVHYFLLQILHCNTACSELPHLTGERFTGEAFAQARARLPLALFDRLLAGVSGALGAVRDEAQTWCGHRLWLIDGTACSMPDTPPLQAQFGQPGGQKRGCGFPVAHLLVLFHAGTGLLQRMQASPLRTNDLSGASAMHASMSPGDVMVGDRAFCSFAHLALLIQGGLHGIFRVNATQIVSFRKGRMHLPPNASHPRSKGPRGLPHSKWVKWLGKCDQVVEYFKPRKRPAWISEQDYAALPEKITVRELRYEVRQPGYRVREVLLVTTLLDPVRYPVGELAQAYYDRWRVEVNIRHLKQTLKMDVLHTRTVAGVEKELRMFALVYNLVRFVMVEAAKLQGVRPDRISFVGALRWLRNMKPEQGLTALEFLVVLPHRPGRVEPRVRKRRPKNYPLMTRPRSELRKELLAKGPKA